VREEAKDLERARWEGDKLRLCCACLVKDDRQQNKRADDAQLGDQ
jgi:hypothetical protein